MAPQIPFSRLQLAAALIEYDNDLDNPNAPNRSAQDSAIFAHFLRNPAARPDLGSRKSNYLGVSLPSETCGTEKDTAMGRRRSRSPLDLLRNPFSADNQSELGLNDGDEEELEVDLESWGLDAFVSKDKAKSAKAKGKEPAVGSTRSRLPAANHESAIAAPRRGLVTSKSVSLGGQLEFKEAISVDRRRSFGSPLELADMEPTILLPPRRVASGTSLQLQSQEGLIPFPSNSMLSPSPAVDHVFDQAHLRTHSFTSMKSKILVDSNNQEQRQRSASMGSMEILKTTTPDNPFAIERPSHSSRFDPKTADRPRSYSTASRASKIILEDDGMHGDTYTKERPYSTLDLLRPKVLVMPSPLQSISYDYDPEPSSQVREGFELSADGPPLPPGARSSRRLSSLSALNPSPNPPLASNAFTPNPLMDLSQSQKTFRNTLVSTGQMLPMESDLPRAIRDGEQIQLDTPTLRENVPVKIDEVALNSSRPAGKLYGKSLIDDLEARKAELRSKQRVFKGDDRQSMMARNKMRSSTLIDPLSLNDRTVSQQLDSHKSPEVQQNTLRRGSLSNKPLLDFDSDEGVYPRNLRQNITNPREARTVFGVDTLWEREMEKLKEIQLQEAREEQENRKLEAQSERKNKKKRKKRGGETAAAEEKVENLQVAPPTLPDIQRTTTRRQPPERAGYLDDESDSDIEQNRHQLADTVDSWHVGSSDEENHGPRRTTGVGPRYPKQPHKVIRPVPEDDSEEDLPLVATVRKARARAALSSVMHEQAISDDEDKPLAQVLRQTKSNIPLVPSNLGNLALNISDSDDDQPLALRISNPQLNGNVDEEDDVPLAFRGQQQRRTQDLVFAQQQQQQQLFMQAQMQNNMLMSVRASMLGGFYAAPPIMNSMAMMPMQAPMQAPMSIPSPPPIVDDANFGRVDRWRRDVVVDGDI